MTTAGIDKMRVLGLLVALLVVSTVGASTEWRRIPGGVIAHRSCINEVPSGVVLDDDLATATKCQHPINVTAPELQIYAADVHQEAEGAAGFTSFTADFTVPPSPKSYHGQTVYFWPGFKSKQPEMGYPVLQPVLQFGEGIDNPKWQLQSWFVDANSMWYPVHTAPAIDVHPGDEITTFMKLDGDTWTVCGKDKTTGQNSTLTISKRRAGRCDYQWAMLVNENINVNTNCDLMPATSAGVTFTNVKLDHQGHWTTRANCKGNAACDCGNSAAVHGTAGDVTLGWHN